MQVKVLRLLEYTGELEEIKEHLKLRGVQGTKRIKNYNENSTIVIQEHFLGDDTSVWDELNLTAKIMLGDDT